MKRSTLFSSLIAVALSLCFAATAFATGTEPTKVTTATGVTVEVRFDAPKTVASNFADSIGALFSAPPEIMESMGFHFVASGAEKITVRTEIIGANVELTGGKTSIATVAFDKNGKASGLFYFRGDPVALAIEAGAKPWVVQTRVEFALNGDSVPFAVALVEYTPQGVVLRGFQATTEVPAELAATK